MRITRPVRPQNCKPNISPVILHVKIKKRFSIVYRNVRIINYTKDNWYIYVKIETSVVERTMAVLNGQKEQIVTVFELQINCKTMKNLVILLLALFV